MSSNRIPRAPKIENGNTKMVFSGASLFILYFDLILKIPESALRAPKIKIFEKSGARKAPCSLNISCAVSNIKKPFL